MPTQPKLVLFGDGRKDNVEQCIDRFLAFVGDRCETAVRCGIEDCQQDLLETADFAVVFGGDGTIISSAKQLSQSRVPVIGVNLGKLGFLAEFSIDELEQSFDDIIAGKTSIEHRMMLCCNLYHDEKLTFTSKAVNDVFITAGPPYRMIELGLSVDRQPLASCVSDGLIVSTPTGSTAYNLSAGGPILSAKLQAMVITPICPHSLSFRPIVISAASIVEVEPLELNKGTTISIDGQISKPLSTDSKLVVKRDEDPFLVVNNPRRSSWDTLAAKLGWAEKPKYKQNQ